MKNLNIPYVIEISYDVLGYFLIHFNDGIFQPIQFDEYFNFNNVSDIEKWFKQKFNEQIYCPPFFECRLYK